MRGFMKIKSSELFGVVILSLTVGIASGLMISQPVRQETVVKIPDVSGREVTVSEAATKLVAVDRQGKGIVTDLSVKTVPGSGRILVDIENLIFFIDTQHSIQVAKQVAESYLNATLMDRDLIYRIRVDNTSIVGGESAGAALTVATIAAVSGKELRNDTVMTGTINPDGTIGPVGGLLEKARAAHEAGYRFFLVPKGQGMTTYVQKEESCERTGFITVCQTLFKPVRVNIGTEVGIDVIEVETIEDAVGHFLPFST